jgi:hypothetical protein
LLFSIDFAFFSIGFAYGYLGLIPLELGGFLSLVPAYGY